MQYPKPGGIKSTHTTMSHETPKPLPLIEPSFHKNLKYLAEAVAYVDARQEDWGVDPRAIEITLPAEQDHLHNTFAAMLEADTERGAMLKNLFEFNIAQLQMQHEGISGCTLLKIDCAPDDTNPKSSRRATRTAEIIQDPSEPNIMVNGLLAITGGQTLRDDIAEGNGTGMRIHKGVFKDAPIYFFEKISPAVVDGKTTYRRCMYAATEQWASAPFNALSDRDIEMMKLLEIDLSAMHDSIPRMDRPRMIETIRLYAAFNAPIPSHPEKNTNL